jgi:radical SAM superfamily enzyme YgiQ (UPF0313 family)
LLGQRMTRITLLQIVRSCARGDSGPIFDMELGQLSAALRAQGFTTSLVRVAEFDGRALREALSPDRTDAVHVVYDGAAVDTAARTLAEIRDAFGYPVTVGGHTATVTPDQALSMPNVEALILGEADHTLPAYLAARRDGRDEPIEGVWRIRNGRVERCGRPAIVADLDNLPWPDRDIFGVTESRDVFELTVGRGCPFRCAYCPNDPLRAASEAGPAFVRRRSPEHICGEIDALCLAYPNTRALRFTDHAFAADGEWLAKFAAAYEAGCGIPFSCHVRANAIDATRADLLKRAGCVSAEVEVINGSDFIRNDILDMETSDEQMETAFALLRDRGIATQAVVFVGAPHSTPMAERKTVELCRNLAPDLIDVRVYYPYEGTLARQRCREEGLLSNRGETAHSDGRSVLDLPQLSPSDVRRVAARMCDDVAGRSPSRLRDALDRARETAARWAASLGGLVRRNGAGGVRRSTRR